MESKQILDQAPGELKPGVEKPRQRSVRVVLPEEMYLRLKKVTLDHGDISRIVRSLLRQFLKKAEQELEEED